MVNEFGILEKRCMLLEREASIMDRDIKQLREQIEEYKKLTQHMVNGHMRSSCVIDGIARLLIDINPEHASKLEKYIEEAFTEVNKRIEEDTKHE